MNEYIVYYVISGGVPPIQSETVQASDIVNAVYQSGIIQGDVIAVKLKITKEAVEM